ncbi:MULTISPECIES: ABC transporter permease [Brevibacterium]|uniref:ABC transporter permease n=1 Tax=Brevibacterium salitolerans TaxID=1403566 RepID=A0ABN2X0I9_9MICO|nr:ABC transporter permease [Brevibacterium sp.]
MSENVVTTPSRATGASGPAPARRGLGSRLLRNPRTFVSGAFFVLVFAAVAFGPALYPIEFRAQVGVPLTQNGLLGTDDFGRDVFARLLVATRTSLLVAAGAVVIALVLGVGLGLLAGFLGGWTSTIIMRGSDILLSFPAVILAIATVAILGPDLVNVVLVIGVIYVPRFTRVVYAQAVSIRSAQYVDAERVNGTPTWSIIARTVLPNVMSTVIVQASLSLSFAIQVEAGLSFLGLGAQPPLASLGTMIASGRDFLEVQPTLLIYPSLILIAIVLAVNVLGDGLRDVLDPRRAFVR